MFEWITTTEGWIALISLVSLEIVLGIDNLIFISILVGRLPESQRDRARLLGLSLALVMRLMLLIGLFWIMKLTAPIISILGEAISGRDIILIGGGLFLLAKSTLEIHHSLEINHPTATAKPAAAFGIILTQIAIVDVVFSLDSVITAIGMVQHISIMVLAVLTSIVVMMLAAKTIGEFVERNPTIKILALAFLILIGVALIAQGLDLHIPKGYIYFAMAFSLSVELINIRARRNKEVETMQLSRYLEGEPKKH
ncbi:membrane protein [Arenicella chitinivorans]|uniref:Membrane protein n=1 Tax=Arenicella chitinivorans TaxID=1329800 RepID=A0A918RIU9_9GAMM|nr:TerC family protein [Arenicella chitinivorans]GHA00517.1 membrane protein [Arenicella chitinivorans]